MKKKEHEKKRTERKPREGGAEASGTTTPPGDPTIRNEAKPAADDDMADISDDEVDNARGSPPSVSPEDQGEGAIKRKREPETPNGVSLEGEDSSSAKKQKTALPPPPPPPPPTDGTTFDEDGNAIESSELVGSAAGSDSFTQDASEGTSADAQSRNERSVHQNRAVKVSGDEVSGADGHPSPMQLATPSTTGSYDGNDKRFEGMNPERLRQLGIANGR
ncbi:uncharacterized protein K452DRAFT_103536 [Aplosporella prunicola CBS 121167]|uniref:Uncharacterized protein n=1 Tax=Aplosporella prunicola CBS 121167 TaxID=1176127 RepID=A0A6A6BP71_9PEZI|nr:uncharacterized protein K452DRAFT_103536 [Aplosporella prunicola CBS 121167]KAF2145930.1 hypothetical protein K452DRAFT_103536 [Aplosporella prunicola CBS 121167]